MTKVERSRALAAIFHDLRTPLSVISGYAELLGMRDDDRTRHEAAAAITEAAEALSTGLGKLDEALRDDPEAGIRRLAQESQSVLPASTRRVLLVDDDPNIRALLRMTLPVDDFTLLEARDGGAAIALAEQEQPDLVLLDWRMPGRGGAEVLSELRRARPSLPLVVLTAERDGGASEEARTLGATAFLTKPFSPLQLLGVVEELLADADPS